MEPKHTPIQVGAINDDRIPAFIFRTYARLVRLTWTHNWEFTDWLDMPALLNQLGGIDRATFFRHAGRLKELELVDWSTDGKNRFRFFILEVRLGQVALSHPCDPSSSSGRSSSSNESELLLEPAKSHPCDKPLMLDVLDQESWHALRDAKIGEPARTRLANLPNVNPHYVRAMAAQAKRDGVTTGGLIFRIENDWPAPDFCDHCGQLDGDHTDSCPTQAELIARQAAESKLSAEHEAELRQEAPAPVDTIPMSEAIERGLALRIADGRAYPVHQVWIFIESELQLQLTTATYNAWLARSRGLRVEDHALIVGVHSKFAKDWLENRMVHLVERTIQSITGHQLAIKFIVSEEVKS